MRITCTALASLLLMVLALPVQAEPYMSPEEPPPLQGVKKTVMAQGLDHPWSMAWLPDGGLLITQRPGGVQLYRDGTLRSVPGAPEVLAEGQGGLLDISLHPDFENNRLVYFTLATGTPRANRTALVRARFDGERLSGVQTLFRASQTKPGGQHFGSRLVWLPDDTLLMSLGDGGNPPIHVDGVLARTLPQDPQSHLGKVLRFTEDGKAAGAAKLQEEGALPELYTMGHRNIQGMTYDPIRDVVWATEHGAKGGDELNRIRAGANYGWPKATYSSDYVTGIRISKHVTLPGMVDPLVVWTPSIAPSGLCLYTGDRFPQWDGDLLAGALMAKLIRRILLDESGRVQGEENLDMGGRVRAVSQGPDGYVYVLTDEDDGKLIRLEPTQQ